MILNIIIIFSFIVTAYIYISKKPLPYYYYNYYFHSFYNIVSSHHYNYYCCDSSSYNLQDFMNMY